MTEYITECFAGKKLGYWNTHCCLSRLRTDILEFQLFISADNITLRKGNCLLVCSIHKHFDYLPSFIITFTEIPLTIFFLQENFSVHYKFFFLEATPLVLIMKYLKIFHYIRTENIISRVQILFAYGDKNPNVKFSLKNINANGY